MLSVLEHFYNYAEVYTVILSWVTVPLFFYASYYFLRKHYGMFLPTVLEDSERMDHGVNR